jgi:hypothetical protein
MRTNLRPVERIALKHVRLETVSPGVVDRWAQLIARSDEIIRKSEEKQYLEKEAEDMLQADFERFMFLAGQKWNLTNPRDMKMVEGRVLSFLQS